MSAATHVAPAGESSPIQAAQEAALKARRMNLASKGAQVLILSLYNAGSGALLLSMDETWIQKWLWVWCFTLAALMFAVPAVIQRRRIKAGAKVLQKNELDFTAAFNPAVSRTYATATIAGCVLGIAAVWAAIFLSHSFESMNSAHFFGLLLAAMMVIPLWRYTRLGFWEDLVVTACMAAAGLVFGLQGVASIGWVFLVMGLGGVVSGWSMDRRWRAFVAALPKEGDA